MSAGGVVAGTATVVIGVDISRLQQGLARMQGKMQQVSAQLNTISSSMLRVAAPIAGAFGFAVKTMASFEDEMAAVGAVTESTDADLKTLSDTARELGSTTSFSAKEAAQGMKFLGQAGFDTKQIMEGIPAVLQLARAGALDLGRAADIASDIGTAFGLAAEDIGTLSDVIAATASNANTNVEMMGETMKFLAPTAKAAGQSLKDTAIATGLVANAGIKGSAAGTSLAVVLRKLADTGIQEKMRELGVEVLTAEGNIKPLVPLLQELGRETAGLAGAEKLALFTELFDARGAKSAINIADATAESVEKLTRKVTDSEGAVARMAKRMEETTGGAWRRMISAASELAITIGFQLKDTIVGFLESLTQAAVAGAKWAKENKGLIITVAKMTAGLIAMAVALKGVAIFIGIISGLAGAMKALSAGAVVAQGAITGLSLGAIAPMLPLVVALTAAFAILYKLWNRNQDLKAIETARRETAKLNEERAKANVALENRTPTQEGAKNSINEIIASQIKLGKTDKEITAGLIKGREVLLAKTKQVWDEKNALSSLAFFRERETAQMEVDAINAILEKGNGEFKRIQEDKTKIVEAENKRRMIIRRKVVEEIKGVEEGLGTFLADLQEQRAQREEDRTFQQQLREDPSGALAGTSSQLDQQEARAAAARKAATDAIAESKKLSSDLAAEEIKALAEKVRKEEEAVDRITAMKLQAEDAVAQKNAEALRNAQQKQQKIIRSSADAGIADTVFGARSNIKEQIAGAFDIGEMKEQTDLQRQMVDDLDTIAANTSKPGGFQ